MQDFAKRTTFRTTQGSSTLTVDLLEVIDKHKQKRNSLRNRPTATLLTELVIGFTSSFDPGIVLRLGQQHAQLLKREMIWRAQPARRDEQVSCFSASADRKPIPKILLALREEEFSCAPNSLRPVGFLSLLSRICGRY